MVERTRAASRSIMAPPWRARPGPAGPGTIACGCVGSSGRDRRPCGEAAGGGERAAPRSGPLDRGGSWAGNVRVEVWDATGNKRQPAEIPAEVPVNRIMVVLVDKLNLPRHGPDGQLMSYKFH